jgi:hypothetical protein
MEKAAGNGESESDYESGVDEAIGVDLADQIVVDQSGEWETPEKNSPYDRREQPGEWRDHHKAPPSHWLAGGEHQDEQGDTDGQQRPDPGAEPGKEIGAPPPGAGRGE